MRYQPIDNSFYSSNRKRFFKCLPESCVVILHSNDILPTNADGALPLIQNSDLFYLSGIDQEETILALTRSKGKTEAHLFIKYTDKDVAIWEGQKLSKKKATRLSGIDKVHWLADFESYEKKWVKSYQTIGFIDNDHKRANTTVQTRQMRYWDTFEKRFPKAKLKSFSAQLHKMRTVKSKEEVNQIQQAIDITAQGFQSVLKAVQPGMMEFEVEALLSHEFIKRGSRRFAYSPIVASGKNACVLHYIENDQPIKKGDLILMDIGAEYGNYNADLTRVVPASGKFSKRQKQVYQAVLNTLKFATSLLKPGLKYDDYNAQVARFISKELLELGLLTKKEAANTKGTDAPYRRYFMHGTSHLLGLDVHDVGPIDTIKKGMVLTCEPGIYILEEGIGIRLENDLLITAKGTKNLMAHIPIEISEIENLMAK